MAFWWFVRNTGCLCFFLCGCEYVCCLRVNCSDADWNFVSVLFFVLGDRILLSTAAPLSFLGLTSLPVLCVVAWLTHNHSSVLPPLPRSSPPLSAETATVCPGLWPDLSCVFEGVSHAQDETKCTGMNLWGLLCFRNRAQEGLRATGNHPRGGQGPAGGSQPQRANNNGGEVRSANRIDYQACCVSSSEWSGPSVALTALMTTLCI